MQGIRLVVYPVKEINQAKTLYSQLLGVEPYVDTAYYVGFKVGDQEIGLDPQGHQRGVNGPLGYWQVSDIEQTLQRYLAAGAQVEQAVRDVGDGKRIATIQDADHNLIGLIQLPA